MKDARGEFHTFCGSRGGDVGHVECVGDCAGGGRLAVLDPAHAHLGAAVLAGGWRRLTSVLMHEL